MQGVQPLTSWLHTFARGSTFRSEGRGNASASSVTSTSGLYCNEDRKKIIHVMFLSMRSLVRLFQFPLPGVTQLSAAVWVIKHVAIDNYTHARISSCISLNFWLEHCEYLLCFGQLSPHHKPPVRAVVVQDLSDATVFAVIAGHVTSLIRNLSNRKWSTLITELTGGSCSGLLSFTAWSV